MIIYVTIDTSSVFFYASPIILSMRARTVPVQSNPEERQCPRKGTTVSRPVPADPPTDSIPFQTSSPPLTMRPSLQGKGPSARGRSPSGEHGVGHVARGASVDVAVRARTSRPMTGSRMAWLRQLRSQWPGSSVHHRGLVSPVNNDSR